MRLATDRQKARLRELDIEFDDELLFEDATLLLRDHLKPVKLNLNLNANALVELSEPDDEA